MTWKTHAAIGANTIWVATLIQPVDFTFLWLACAAAFAALLPDIDASRAKIHFIIGGFFSAARNHFHHRGFFHSILAVSIVFLISFVLLSPLHHLLPIIIPLAYLSHPIIDGFNYSGVQYLFPLKKKFRLVPKLLRTRVEGLTDQTLFVIGLLGFLLFIGIHYQAIIGPIDFISFENNFFSF